MFDRYPRRRAQVLLGFVLACAIGLMAAPSALAVTTTEGPYGSTTFADYGTCGNNWATFSNGTTHYFVSSQKPNGTYNLKLKITGRFTSIAGQSPGACLGGNTTITNGVRGSFSLTFYFVVSGGTFDPSATCDASCGNDYSLTGLGVFVTNFFGGSATTAWSGRDSVETAHSGNLHLISKAWTETFVQTSGPITGSTGDIATS